jgi:hypothetical protein
MRQAGKAAVLIERLGGVVSANCELDDRAAKLLRVGGHPRDQRPPDTALAVLKLDNKVLQENHRPIPSGDDAPAARRHAHDGLPGNRMRVFGLGDEGREAGLRAKAVAQPIGRLSRINSGMSVGCAARTRNDTERWRLYSITQ